LELLDGLDFGARAEDEGRSLTQCARLNIEDRGSADRGGPACLADHPRGG
jgi:hypothetical protein